MAKILTCPSCGHRQSYQLQKPDKGDAYPPPQVVACGNDEGGCFGYFAATYAGEIFPLDSRMTMPAKDDFAKTVRTATGEQVMIYIEQGEQDGLYRIVGMARYPTIDSNHCTIFEGSLAECEAQLAAFDQKAAARFLTRARHM